LLQRIERIEKSTQRSHYFSSPNFSAPQDEFVLVEETIPAQEDGYPGQPLPQKAELLPKSLAREEELREDPSVRCVHLQTQYFGRTVVVANAHGPWVIKADNIFQEEMLVSCDLGFFGSENAALIPTPFFLL
jgi:hypothetical protein